MSTSPALIGPILILDDVSEGQARVSALFLSTIDAALPPVNVNGTDFAPSSLAHAQGTTLWRARFALPTDAPSSYSWNGTTYDVASDFTGDLSIAFVSCNGQEHGDMDRPETERDVMWARLGDRHRETPFSLLLHGGDQVYADEVTDAHPLTEGWPTDVPQEVPEADLAEVYQTLFGGFFDRYVHLYRSEAFGWIAARVPSLMQWDDHDICDGWGSQPETATNSTLGETLFAAAKDAALLFQHGCTSDDLPGRFTSKSGAHLGWSIATLGLSILAPDLRSERTRYRVMGPEGWTCLEMMAAQATEGHVFLMSSVPLLGPRLSILEGLMNVAPGLQKYEDDLRDQWQSRAHRTEWQKILRLVDGLAGQDGVDVTALSGEIHLATRATMAHHGEHRFHQLVASGITHTPPPNAWARALGALAIWGEDPLPDHKIAIHPLPGQRRRYSAERNFLMLTQHKGRWSARWDLENTGLTPALPL